jgi:hypothetical protein
MLKHQEIGRKNIFNLTKELTKYLKSDDISTKNARRRKVFSEI